MCKVLILRQDNPALSFCQLDHRRRAKTAGRAHIEAEGAEAGRQSCQAGTHQEAGSPERFGAQLLQGRDVQGLKHWKETQIIAVSDEMEQEPKWEVESGGWNPNLCWSKVIERRTGHIEK